MKATIKRTHDILADAGWRGLLDSRRLWAWRQHDAVASLCLGRIKGPIGAADELGGGLAGNMVGDPDRDRDVADHGFLFTTAPDPAGKDRRAQCLGQADGSAARRLRQDDGELLATITGRGILALDVCAQP